MVWVPFRTHLGRLAECFYNGGTPPAATSFYLILVNGGTINDTSSLATVLAQELPIGTNGYARLNYDPSTGAYDATQERYELPSTTLSFSASGGALQFDKVVLLGGAAATGSSGELVFYQAQGSPTTIPDGSTYDFRVGINFGSGTADVNAS